MAIVMKKEHIEEMLKHAEQEMPDETCGIIAGNEILKGENREKIVKKIYKCINVLKSPYRYRISPQELLTVLRDAEEKNLEILGFYHSHPFRESFLEPSEIDRAEAHWEEASYFIVSPLNKTFASWRLTEKGFKREEVNLSV